MRLTQVIREKILQIVLEHGIKPRTEALEQLNAEIGVKIYQHSFQPVDVAHALQLLPSWCTTYITEFNVRTIGAHEVHFSLKDDVKVPDPGNDIFTFPPEALSQELMAEINKYEKAVMKLEEDRKTLQAEARGVLRSVQTSTQLLERWPELQSILPPDLFQPSYALVPISTIKKLNRTLGLKVGQTTVN